MNRSESPTVAQSSTVSVDGAPKPARNANLLADIALARTGDIEARNRIITDNMPLAVLIYQRYPVSVEMDDSIQEGVFAIDAAIRNFDPDLGWQFSTYVAGAIRRRFQRLSIESGMVRVPQSAHDRRGARTRTYRGSDFSRMILADDDECPVAETELVLRVQRAMLRLEDREATVLRLRFNEGMTLTEAGERVGVSREMIRRIQKNALAKLRSFFEPAEAA